MGLQTAGEPEQGNVLTEFQWENIFQLTEAGQYWLDLSAYVEYAKGLEHGDDQALEWKLLLEKSVGPWVAVANPLDRRARVRVSRQQRASHVVWERGTAEGRRG